jgi:hypothetical protein
LKADGHIKTTIPMFGGVGNTRCDESGNLFYNAGSLITDHGPYLKISSDGQGYVIFTLPADVNTPGNGVWAITPEGTLYVLRSDSDTNKLVRFAGDGEVKGISSLALPKGVNIRRMAVANNGTVFVEGYLEMRQDDSKLNPGFAATFDDSGKMIDNLSAGASAVDRLATTKQIPEGDLIAGDDGRFYGLEPDEVRIFNQLGEQTSSLKINKPSKDALALRIDESRGWISVIFYTPSTPKPGWAPVLEPTAVLMNAQAEVPQRTFTFDPALTGSVECYNAQHGYTMAAVDSNMLAFDYVAVW